jgi:hypothetical protein
MNGKKDYYSGRPSSSERGEHLATDNGTVTFTDEKPDLYIRLCGPKKPTGIIEVEDLKILMDAIYTSLERLSLKELEGKRSLTPGRRSASIKSHIRLFLTSVSSGSVKLGMKLWQDQQSLRGEPVGATIVKSWLTGVGHIQTQGVPPANFDRGVLSGLNLMKPLFKRGYDEIHFKWQDAGGGETVKVTYDYATDKQIEAFLIKVADNRRTLSGIILEADYHMPEITFTLYVNGEAIKCVADEELMSHVLDGTLHNVRVSGDAETDSETKRIKRLRVDNIDVMGFAEISIPPGLIAEFWGGVELGQLIERQNVTPYDENDDLKWEPPTDEEAERYFDVILKKPARKLE